MKSKGIRRAGVLRERGVPSNLLRTRKQVECRGRQGGHVQRLADVASRIVGPTSMPIGVLVQCRAGNEIQQGQAAQ
jgi:hypothetical protein